MRKEKKMFDIVYSLILDFINMLKWFIPMLIVFGFIGGLINVGGRR